jgi:uncharacterized coiled-coil DUF342 family protein
MDNQTLEVHTKLNDRIGSFENRIESMENKLDALNEGISEGVTKIGELFESADKRFDEVEEFTKKIAT